MGIVVVIGPLVHQKIPTRHGGTQGRREDDRPVKAPALKLGEDLEIVAESCLKSSESRRHTSGFTPDGKLLGTVSLPEQSKNDGIVGGELLSQSHPVLYDLETRSSRC